MLPTRIAENGKTALSVVFRRKFHNCLSTDWIGIQTVKAFTSKPETQIFLYVGIFQSDGHF